MIGTSLPQDWTLETLGTCCEAPQYGWTTRALGARPGLKLLRTTDITHGPVDWSSVPACRVEPPDRSRFLLADGDIVISRAGSIGASAVIRKPPPAVFASYLIRFRPRDRVLSSYLAYFLQSENYWRQVREGSVGIALQNINAKKLAAVEFPLAPLEEQRRIVRAIESNFARLWDAESTLRRVRNHVGWFRESLVDATVGATFREGWPLEELPRLCTQIVDCPHSTPKYGEGEYFAVDTTCIAPGRIVQEKLRRVNRDEFHERVRRLTPIPGDVVLAREGTIGTAAIIPEDPPVCLGQRVMLLRVGPSITPQFLQHALMCRGTRAQFTLKIAGSTVPHLNVRDVRGLRIPVPTRSRQISAVDRLEHGLSLAETALKQVEVNSERSSALRNAILRAAYTGKLTGTFSDHAYSSPASAATPNLDPPAKSTKVGR